MRRRVRSNLRRVLGHRASLVEQVDVTRTFANFASCLTEALALGGSRPRHIEREVFGGEHLGAALQRGKGLIVVTAHTGGWETTGPLLKSDFGLDVMIVMQREADPRARQIQDLARARSGIKVIHVGTDALAVLPLFTHLRRGGVLGIQLDRIPPGMRGLEVSLFGQPTLVPRGPFDLAAATGAPILPIFCHRLGYFRYGIEICPPIQLVRGAPPEALASGAQEAALQMERFVRAHPTHWFHFVEGP
jgi:KDO2-lipid IV(A) lauroyltransferase